MSALLAQEKYEEIIETFVKIESFQVKKTPGIYALGMTANAQLGKW